MAENVKVTFDRKTRINENGRIVIPAAIRTRMNLKPGDSVLMRLDQDGVLRIESHMARIRKIQDELKKYGKPGVLMSDELIAERREEARREMEEWLG
ncbi:MAG TPA: AbrB/MazE/SpoVT family DNA-binding domain-containing protein [Terracidiphilus sp.]|nr:AbrB/MazE/SpoVT family DNA-binding domain-containing protein [Terracidiphilus sp.]